jgi:hypothetical protein
MMIVVLGFPKKVLTENGGPGQGFGLSRKECRGRQRGGMWVGR